MNCCFLSLLKLPLYNTPNPIVVPIPNLIVAGVVNDAPVVVPIPNLIVAGVVNDAAVVVPEDEGGALGVLLETAFQSDGAALLHEPLASPKD